MPIAKQLWYLGFGRETTPGTAVVATAFAPVTDVKPSDKYNYQADKGIRGSFVEQYGDIATQSWAELGFDMDFYPDIFGWFLKGLLGDETVAGAGAPYTHAFSVLNTGSGQPPTTTFVYYNGFNARKMPFGLFSELAIKYDATNLIKVSGKAASFASSVVTAPTKSFSALLPQPSWKASATIGGVATGLLESADVTIKRSVVPIVALNGTQTPYKMWAQAVSVGGKATIIYEDDTFLTDYTAGVPVAFDLNFTTGAGAAAVGLQLHCTSAQFTKADVVMGSKDYVQLDIDWRGEGNTTDAGASGGQSNVKVTLTNAQAGAY